MRASQRTPVPVDFTGRRDNTALEPTAPTSTRRPVGRIARSAVPWLAMTYDELRALPLDPRMAFVLSRVDGRSNVEIILDLTSLPADETLDVLDRLVELGAIELHDPDRLPRHRR
jgi:hypothetical protein